MMKNHWIFIALTLFTFSFVQLYSQDTEGQEALYNALIEQDRQLKDERFKDAEASPFQDAELEKFKSLNYFDPDMKYKVEGEFRSFDEQESEALISTDGNKIDLIRYGKVNFELNGKSFQLIVYRDANLPELSDNPGQLFIPFRDKTNGNETNENGRYLALNMPEENGTVELDFNLAFNPYSAYGEKNISVVPPDENMIEEVLMTGERKYEDR